MPMEKDGNGGRRGSPKPKPENMFYARRLREALQQKGWRGADLARELVRRGMIAENPRKPGEPASQGRVHDWLKGISLPEEPTQQAIADIFGYTRSWFIDPEYVLEIGERVIEKATEIFPRMLRTGGDFVTEAEQELGTPEVTDSRKRRFFRANQAELVALLKKLARTKTGHPWEALTATEQRQFVEQLLREEPEPG